LGGAGRLRAAPEDGGQLPVKGQQLLAAPRPGLGQFAIPAGGKHLRSPAESSNRFSKLSLPGQGNAEAVACERMVRLLVQGLKVGSGGLFPLTLMAEGVAEVEVGPW